MLTDHYHRYQTMPDLSPDAYEALKADIKARGVQVPVDLDENGEILDGHQRARICQELGITDYPRIYRVGLTEEQKFEQSLQLNLQRRHLTTEQKREAIARQLQRTPEKSDRQVAAALGVSDPTVGKVRKEMEREGELLKLSSCEGKDGKVRPRAVTKSVYARDQREGKRAEKAIAAVDPEKLPEKATVAEVVTLAEKPHVAQATGEQEWYTPPEYIEAARAVMGGIDCDPASSETANKIVKADVFFTAEQDGLKQVWGKRVWLNPPYSQPLISQFVHALVTRWEAGEVEQACVLVNNATETEWGQRLLEACSLACFIRGRVRFLNADGMPVGSPLQGQMLLYFGENVARCRPAFSKFGSLLAR